jgi:iron complex outermembrane recepter protein
VGGYNEYTYHSLSDFDGLGVSLSRQSYTYTPPAVTGAGTPVTIHTGQHLRFAEDKSYYSNDLQLISTGEGAVSFVAGLYQYHEKYEQIPIAQGFVNPNQSQLLTVYRRPAVLPTTVTDYNAMTQIAYSNPLGAYNLLMGNVKVDSYAGYGQIDWRMTDQWKVAVGGRYSRDEKSGIETRRTVVWNPTIAGAATKAFDNSPTTDCYVPVGQRNSVNPVYDRVINRATGAEITAPVTTGNYTGICGTREFEKRVWSKFTPSAVIEWKPMDDFLAYAKYTMGYKAGAIRVANMDIDSETNPEKLDSFEVGTKITLAERYQFNISGFYYDYSDYQFPVTKVFPQPDGTNSTVREYANIDAMSAGAELELRLSPVDPLTILLNYSYVTTETTSDLFLLDNGDPMALGAESTYPNVRAVFVGTTGPFGQPQSRVAAGGTGTATGFENQAGYQYYQNAKGGVLPNSPEHKASGSVSYNFKFAAGSLIPSLRYNWRGSVASAGLGISPLARRRNSTPSYGTGDATITWNDSDGRYRIIGSVNNVFDDQSVNSVAVASNDINTRILNLNPPRTWAVTFQYNFGSERR